MDRERCCRRLLMDGVANFRDLGGYACEGGVTRYNTFFRSTSLWKATKEDIARMESLNITTVIDLRYPHEAEEMPDILGENMRYHNCSLMGTVPLERLRVVHSSVPDTRTLSRMYRMMLQHGTREILRAFQILADAEGAVLFHCAAGKDRTGVLAMLLLALEGVEKADIYNDYQCSSLYITEFTDDISGSNVANMQCLIEWMGKKWGSVRRYLENIGVSGEIARKIHAKFVNN